ncbi:hypothetical protein [Halococcus salifodinae]|uniref:hypothetical protein n=1 Tax=Halococcus salifodinae TaxID=36738 RepID=UPI000AB58819|nr:hypothetical protein [Halococcus salifodinae]
MTLQYHCDTYDLTITSQSSGDSSAFEADEYQCCERTDPLVHEETTGTTLSGCLR